jgi:hypothetical protein
MRTRKFTKRNLYSLVLSPNLIKFGQYVQKKILKLLEFKGHRVHVWRSCQKYVYFKLFCPNLMKFAQYVQKRHLRLIGYKGHPLHTGDHVDPAF